MKKIFLLLNIFAVCLLASCNKNEFATFDDKDAFVAFGKASYAISEDGGSLTIPVTLASVAGVETTVTVSGVDGTAVNGVDYKVKNGGNLTFNAQTRTANVEIEIINRAGEYTGDLNFTLSFSNLGGVAAGAQATTAITIQDNDHPLSFILGDYTVSAVGYWDGPMKYTMTIKKDAADETKVWFFDMFGLGSSWAGDDTMFYGVVSPDKTTITIPLGQGTEYKYSNGEPITLLGFDGANGYDAGNIICTISNDGKNLDFGTEFGFWFYIEGAGNLQIINAGITAEKQ
jgi:hypothetical protein